MSTRSVCHMAILAMYFQDMGIDSSLVKCFGTKMIRGGILTLEKSTRDGRCSNQKKVIPLKPVEK